MSKSRNNFINIFQSDKALKKQIMGIVTDNTPLEEPKNPDTCHVFALYKLLATPEQVAKMRENYQAGNYGYGHAKTALFEVVLDKFKETREKYDYYISHPEEVDKLLETGAKKAKSIAQVTLKRVREKLGYE